MSAIKKLIPGWAGTLFVSACCLGAGPLLASAAIASGAGFLAPIFSIYVLGPLVIVSVAWTIINSWRWSRALTGAPNHHPPLWFSVAGGLLVVVGVFLPPLTGARTVATVAIYLGIAGMILGAILNLVEQRQRARGVGT